MSEFKYDVFISYAHTDNNPEAGVRWVDSLQDALAKFLQFRLGRAARIWRDTAQLKTGDDFETKILEALEQSASIVVATTSTFVKREWFTKEYQQFLAAEKPPIPNKTRILIVYKTKMAQEELPEYFRQFIGFNMFVEEPEGETSTLLPTGETNQLFFLKASKIADAIQQTVAQSDAGVRAWQEHRVDRVVHSQAEAKRSFARSFTKSLMSFLRNLLPV